MFALLLVAAAAGAWFLRNNFSPDKLIAEISAVVLRQSGFALSVEAVDLTWSGDIRLKRICLRNPTMVSGRCFISADIVSLDLALAPLLKKQIEIRGAHFDAVEVSFFTERAPGVVTEMKSWQSDTMSTQPHTPQGEQAAADARFKLKSLRVTNGRVLHETKILPIPLGKTAFDAKLDYLNARQKLVFSMLFPDASRIDSELNIQSENLLGFMRALLNGREVAASNRIQGTVKCQNCQLSSFDSRLQALNGDLGIESEGAVVTLKSEKGEVGVASPIRMTLVWSGFVALDVARLNLTQGKGRLTGPGLAIDYGELGSDEKGNLKINFAVAAELGALATHFSSAAKTTGSVYASGKIEKGQVAAQLKVSKLAVRRGDLPALTAETLSAAYYANALQLNRQHLALAGQPFETSAKILLSGRAPVIAGNVVFPALKVKSLMSGEKDAQGDIELTPFSADILASATGIQLDKISAGFSRGTISGKYTFTSEGGRHSARLNLSRVKTQDLSEALKLRATVFAVLDGRCDLAFAGGSFDEMKKNVTGTLTASIGRGKIKDSFLQKGILNGPLHKLEEKFSDTEFESASLDAAFNAGAVSLKKLYFDASEFDVNLRAEAAAGGQGKAALNFRFRTSFVENVANPLHMGIESLREGDYYNLPFACRGDVFSSACYTKNW